jgi:hypothetical protein
MGMPFLVMTSNVRGSTDPSVIYNRYELMNNSHYDKFRYKWKNKIRYLSIRGAEGTRTIFRRVRIVAKRDY